MMSGDKRPAQQAFGAGNQLVVKRKKSDADLNSGTAVVKSSSGQNGALVQSVRLDLRIRRQNWLTAQWLTACTDSSHQRARRAYYGAHR